MKIIVFSDSHGRTVPMANAICDERPDMMLFLGDGLRDLSDIRGIYPELIIRAVCGNCDFGSVEAERDEFVCGDKRIIMAHGHKNNVKLGYEGIINMACCAGADVLLFGHTHRQVCFDVNGMTVMNPGSVSRGEYGVLEISGGRLSTELKTVK